MHFKTTFKILGLIEDQTDKEVILNFKTQKRFNFKVAS